MKRLIVINGPASVGKSTVASLIHEQIKPSYLLSFDSIRRFLNDYHELPLEGRIIRNNIVLGMLDTLLQEDLTIILEQLHTDEVMLEKYKDVAKKHRVDVREYFLWTTTEQELLNRFEGRQQGPTKHLNSSLNEERVSNYWHTMKKFVETRNKDSTIITDKMLPQQIADGILLSLDKHSS